MKDTESDMMFPFRPLVEIYFQEESNLKDRAGILT